MRVLFYSDVANFGGHEMMAARIADQLALKGLEVKFAFASSKLSDKLSSKVDKIQIKPATRRPFALFQSFRLGSILQCNKLLAEINPDVIVVVQGTIEQCTSVYWSPLARRSKLVSYLPIAYPLKDTGAFLGAFRDFFAHYVYGIPNGWILISEHQRKLLNDIHKVKKPACLVHNCVFDIEIPVPSYDCSKPFRIVTIGRLEAKDKGLDRVPTFLKALLQRAQSFIWTFVGDGPYASELGSIAKRYSTFVRLEPWSNSVSNKLQEADVVVFLSRYEGVPLVMLEALLARRPVIAPNLTAFSEYLPESWLFRNEAEFCEALKGVAKDPNLPDTLEHLRNFVLSRHSTEVFDDSIGSLAKWFTTI